MLLAIVSSDGTDAETDFVWYLQQFKPRHRPGLFYLHHRNQRIRLGDVCYSEIGTFETCRGGLTMSVGRGRPEVAGPRSKRRD
jgi:hypothetical protein